MSKHGYRGDEVGNPDQDTLSISLATLPSTFLACDSFSFSYNMLINMEVQQLVLLSQHGQIFF